MSDYSYYSDEYRKKLNEKVLKKLKAVRSQLKTVGIDKKTDNLNKENLENFGLQNNFPNLDDEQKRKLNDLFYKREIFARRFYDAAESVDDGISYLKRCQKEFFKVNDEICVIQGHRLSNSAELVNVDGEMRAKRICIICGKEVYDNTISRKDVVVDLPKQQAAKKVLSKAKKGYNFFWE